MSARKRILIVDDEEALTFSLYQSFILSKNDFEVVTAGSGEDALEKIEKQPFDLMITDISMPGISGLELLEIVKSKHPDTKVIVMTAYGASYCEEEAVEKGANQYIEKPFEIKEVKRLVLSMLD